MIDSDIATLINQLYQPVISFTGSLLAAGIGRYVQHRYFANSLTNEKNEYNLGAGSALLGLVLSYTAQYLNTGELTLSSMHNMQGLSNSGEVNGLASLAGAIIGIRLVDFFYRKRDIN